MSIETNYKTPLMEWGEHYKNIEDYREYCDEEKYLRSMISSTKQEMSSEFISGFPNQKTLEKLQSRLVDFSKRLKVIASLCTDCKKEIKIYCDKMAKLGNIGR